MAGTSIIEKFKSGGTLVRNALVGIVFVIAVFLLYTFFLKSDEGGSILVSGTDTKEHSALILELVTLLRNLQKIELDTSILEDEAFRSLEDLSVPVRQEPRGRRNPFAPLE